MKYTIQTKILTGFILVLMAIGLIGYEVHNQMTTLASSLYKKNDQQNNLVVFQKILSTLAEAESSVRTFSITDNPEDIDLFFRSKKQLDSYLSDLDKNIGKNKYYRSLHNNIDYKIYLMQRMIELKKRNPAQNIIDEALKEINEINRKNVIQQEDRQMKARVIEELERQVNLLRVQDSLAAKNDSVRDEKAIISEATKEKEGFLQHLFHKKEISKDTLKTAKHEADKAPDSANYSREKQDNNKIAPGVQKSPKKSSNHTIIQQSLQKLKKAKSVETAVWQQAMLILIQEDARIMNKIRQDMSQLEKQELNYNSQFIAVAARSKDRIINNTKIIAIGAFTIILSLSVVVFQDFKKIRKNRQSLIDEKDRASRLAKVKEEFLANMSHEIRTPMNAIVGYSELLEKTDLRQDQIEYLATIQQSSNHLMVILNDILDYSKLESGKLTISQFPFSPKKCIEQVVKSMQRDAEKKKNEMKVIFHRSVEDRLIGDSVRFQQILYNLVSNAIKFTHRGTIQVEARGVNEVEGYILQLKVKDNGIGIKKEYLKKIFENFEQLNMGRERKYGGTGLGLAIVKRLVDLQQGSIHVKSEEGRGSSFIIRIPYIVAPKQEQAVQKKEGDDSLLTDFSKLSILAVDDQEYNLELIRIILEKWGVKVDLATSGDAAVQLFHHNSYDLILMDVQMPQVSGLEATHLIRTSETKDGKTIPIIALTAASTKEETERCLKAGMNDYLLKPFKQNELRQMIIRQQSAGQENREHGMKTVTFNLEHLKALSNGDDFFVVNMLEVFIKNTRHDMIRLEDFIYNKDWKSAGLQAHKMVASSRHLRIDPLVNLLEELERKGINEQDIDHLTQLFEEIKHVAYKATHLLEKEIEKIKVENKKQPL